MYTVYSVPCGLYKMYNDIKLSEVDALVQKFINKYCDDEPEKFCAAETWNLYSTSSVQLRSISREMPLCMRLFMRNELSRQQETADQIISKENVELMSFKRK